MRTGLVLTIAVMLVVLLSGNGWSARQAGEPPHQAVSAQRGGNASEQTPPPPPDESDSGSVGAGRMGRGRGPEDRGKFEQLRMRKMLELLDLRGDQRDKFLEAFREFRHAQRQLDQQRDGIVDGMAEELKQQHPDDQKLNRQMDQLIALEQQRHLGMEGLIKQSRQILTPVQTARLIVFQQKFDAAAFNMARQYMRRMPPPGQMPDSEQAGRR